MDDCLISRDRNAVYTVANSSDMLSFRFASPHRHCSNDSILPELLSVVMHSEKFGKQKRIEHISIEFSEANFCNLQSKHKDDF